MDAIDDFAAHVVTTRFDDLPEAVVGRAKVFILDTLGVGLAGSDGPGAARLVAAQAMSGEGHAARVWPVTVPGCRRPQRPYATLTSRTAASSIACTKRPWCMP